MSSGEVVACRCSFGHWAVSEEDFLLWLQRPLSATVATDPTRREMSPYHFSLTIHQSFEVAVDKTKAALAEHGFEIVSEIDMSKLISEKLGEDHYPYLILGVANPGFFREAVDSEPSVGVLLPSNVVVRADADRVMIDFMDPSVVLDLVGEEGVHDLAEEIRTRLEMTRDAIATHH